MVKYNAHNATGCDEIGAFEADDVQMSQISGLDEKSVIDSNYAHESSGLADDPSAGKEGIRELQSVFYSSMMLMSC